VIGLFNYTFYNDHSFSTMMLILLGASIGAFPMGALGYLIGDVLDIVSARNALILVNLLFLFMTFVPKNIQNILAWFWLPNVWMEFSERLALGRYFYTYGFFVFVIYFILFLLLIKRVNLPHHKLS